MGWFNFYGLIAMAVIMIPNIVYAAKNKGAASIYRNKVVETAEQIGRYGCLALMIFNIPYTYFNFWFEFALVVYLVVNGGLLVLYLVFWAVLWKKQNLLKALALSVLPSAVFLFSGVMLLNIPLLAAAAIFAPAHITISCKSAVAAKKV